PSIKCKRARTRASVPQRREMSIRPGGVRLIAALLLLAAPLVVAAWSLGGYSAQRERNSADTQLANSLNRAGGTYRDLLSSADSRAGRIANRPRYQRELRSGPPVLYFSLRPSTLHPHGQILPSKTLPAAAAVRSVDVQSAAGKKIGQV